MTKLGRLLPAVAAVGLGLGMLAWILGLPALAAPTWAATTLVVLLPVLIGVISNLVRRRLGVDIIALLAMTGAMALGEYLAGAVVALMLSGGQALEAFAGARARRELSSLLDRAPGQAHRLSPAGVETVPVDQVVVGDSLVVNSGEVIPVDGLVAGAAAAVDESALTGEAGAVERLAGDPLRSGTVNVGSPIQMRATTKASDSTYAGIVRLVEQAQAARAPFVRMADRYAVVFLPITLVVAGAAWALSGDPVRALAVLVVATPCPLILAAPVALVGGISRAARRGIIVKGGGALEALAQAKVLLLDKTGTLTLGQPRVAEVVPFGRHDPDRILTMAASLEQLSSHVYAQPVVAAARDRGMSLGFPEGVEETPGAGVRGVVGGHRVGLGKRGWVSPDALPASARRLARRAEVEGAATVYVAIDGVLVGALLLEDSIRPETPRAIRRLRKLGLRSVIMVTGDRAAVAVSVGEAIGADRVLAERTPAEKVQAVHAAGLEGATVMVGDGINDAAALAAAGVGVAMAARGASAASESADVVLMVDRLDRLADGVEIAKRARRIALQSVLAGMGLSGLAMLAAAGGLLVPVAGAVLQEVIDLAVILNALRILGGGQSASFAATDIGEQFRAEHRRLLPAVANMQAVADGLGTDSCSVARQRLVGVATFLREELLPHEQADGTTLYPAVAKLLGGDDPTGPMTRAHLEIAHLARRYLALTEGMTPSGPTVEEVSELRRLLYSLHAILRLHFAQEDEAYLSLFEEAEGSASAGRTKALSAAGR